jgi:hypothetical protein
MAKEKEFADYVWVIIVILSSIFIIFTMFIFSQGDGVFPRALQLAGSTQVVEDIEEKALGFINMSMLKPLWEEIWIGVFGILFAVGLKKKMKYAWTLSLIWGVMLIVNAAIQGGYEVIILKWSNACVQTYIFLILGIIAVVSILFARRGYSRYQTS